jgi:PAS domain S-box-containing protein
MHGSSQISSHFDIARIAAAPGATEKRASTPLVSARILIVEDGLIIAEDLRRRCEALGYTVTGIAATGEDAVFIADRTRPDLVLMDIRLRGTMDGIEAARQIRTTLSIPIVYATSSSDEATLIRAKETEPFGYLLKPVEPRELHTTIELALHRRARETEMRRTQELYRMLINAYTEPVILMDVDGVITACNSDADNILGPPPDPVRARNLLDFIPPEERQAVATGLAGIRAGTQAREAQIKCTLLDAGRTRVASTLSIRPLRDNNGVPRALLAVILPAARQQKNSQVTATPR